MQNLKSVQEAISSGCSDDLLVQEEAALLDLNTALQAQELFWKDKARVDWHTGGDRNTVFFHKLVKVRNASRIISLLKDGESILDKQEDIESQILNYYKDMFASPNTCIDNGLIEEVISPEVTESDNTMLTSLPTLDEVKKAVFGMKANGSPGPDGFGGSFYQTYCDLVGHDVFNSVSQFFKKGWMLPNLNSNTVVLVPKTPNADSSSPFRPISLANYQFKIITKIMADMLCSLRSC